MRTCNSLQVSLFFDAVLNRVTIVRVLVVEDGSGLWQTLLDHLEGDVGDCVHGMFESYTDRPVLCELGLQNDQ